MMIQFFQNPAFWMAVKFLKAVLFANREDKEELVRLAERFSNLPRSSPQKRILKKSLRAEYGHFGSTGCGRDHNQEQNVSDALEVVGEIPKVINLVLLECFSECVERMLQKCVQQRTVEHMFGVSEQQVAEAMLEDIKVRQNVDAHSGADPSSTKTFCTVLEWRS